MNLEIIVPIVVILVFGLPHGAADGVLAYHILISEPKKYIKFLMIYIAIGVCVIIIWFAFPLLSLGTFLTISAIHFGLMDTEKTKRRPLRLFRAIIHGSTILVVIPYAHLSEVKYILDLLVGHDTLLVLQALRFSLYFWCLGVLIIIVFPSLRSLLALIELGLISALAFFLPPLWSFATYFCVIHSSRHFQKLYLNFRHASDWKKPMAFTLVITLVSLSLVLCAAWIIPSNNLIEGMIRATFIGLAAFTVPHVLFIDLFGAVKKLRLHD